MKPKSGTYARIYAVIRTIPHGRVATYGQVAAVAGIPNGARQVGYALFASPAGAALPWHRVLGAGGRITLAKIDPSAALTQRLRLEKEGVRFTARGTVDLAASGWKVSARPRSRSASGAHANKVPRPRATATRPRRRAE